MKSSDRIIVWALAISLAIHAAFLAAVHFTRPVEAQEQPTRVSIRTIVRVPPPTPTPKPVTQPTHTQPHTAKPNVNLTKTIAKKPGSGIDTNTPGPASTSGPGDVGPDVTGSPEPTATPKPQCSTPYAPASVVNAMPAEAPQAAEGETGTAQVKVDLAATGAVLGVEIYKTAGNLFLDRAAMRAARASTYKAETRACESVGGSYLFTVEFQQP